MDQILGIGRTVYETSTTRDKLYNIFDRYDVPESLRSFYSRIHESEKVVVGEFHFNTINEIVELYVDIDTTDNDELIQWLNIGHKYLGMGHMCIMVFDPRVQKFYFRHDGGANGWERESIYNYFEGLEFNPNNPKFRHNMFDFNDALQHIVTNDYENYMLSEP